MRFVQSLALVSALALFSGCVRLGDSSQAGDDGDGTTTGLGIGTGIGTGGAPVPDGIDRLDTSFGGGSGMATLTLSNAKELAQSIVAQAGSKPVVLGSCQVSSSAADKAAVDFDLCAVRFATDGTKDTTFGSSGVFRSRLSTGDDMAAGLVRRSDDSFFAAATKNASADADMAVLRIQKDGALDTTWGSNGIAVVSYPANRASHARGLAVDSQGRAVVAGFTFVDSNVSTAAIARLTADGRGVDPTFGVGGNPQYQVGTGALRVNFATGLGQGFSAVTLDNSGRIVAVGYVQQTTHRDAVVARFTADGILDTTFNGKGFLVVNSSGTNDDDARAVRVDASNKIVVGGVIRTGQNADFAVFKLLDAGTMDSSFSGVGWARYDVQPDDSLSDLVLEDSRVLLLGSASVEGLDRPVLLRIGPNGQRELKLVPYPTWSRAATFAGGVLVDANTLVTAGSVYNGASQFDLFLGRFLR